LARKSTFSTLMGGDPWIWGIYIVLVFISLVELGSASSRLAYRQITNDNPLMSHAKHILTGFFVFIWALQRLSAANIRWVKILGALSFVSGVLLMAALPFFGREINGAHRDIFGIQPVELCKIGLLICLCRAVAAKDSDFRMPFFRKNTEWRRYLLLLAMMAITIGPIALQNLSSAIILGLSAFGIMFLGKVNGKYLWRTLAVVVASAALLVGALFGLHELNQSREDGGGTHHTDLGLLSRANTWEHRLFHSDSTPLWEQNLTDENMQVMYAHMAIANSKGIGTFIGESQMRDHLPEAYSDYIYAIIFEETGILGAAIVMLLYFVLLWRCYKLSVQTDDQLTRLLMVGLPLSILIQALIHMGVTTDAMFVTGQPLPLISRGGMSIMGTSALFGIMLGLSEAIRRQNQTENDIEN